MKLHQVPLIVRRTAERVAQEGYLAEAPAHGRWAIDLLQAKAYGGEEQTIDLPFTRNLQQWLLKQLEAAQVHPRKIESAQLALDFGVDTEATCRATCEILLEGKRYVYEHVFRRT